MAHTHCCCRCDCCNARNAGCVSKGEDNNEQPEGLGETLSKISYTIARLVLQSGTPCLVTIICLAQVLIHYLKTPHEETLSLQFDPLRRYEVWRYLTPFLVHQGRDDGDEIRYDLHLWTSIIFQLLCGYRLESILGWKHTVVIYVSISACATLVFSAWKPCEFSIGSSGLVSGLITANIVVHVMMPYSTPDWWWKITAIPIVSIAIFSILIPAFLYFTLGDITRFGGALGAALTTIIVSFNHPLNGRRRPPWLKKACYVVLIVCLDLTLTTNLMYLQRLKCMPDTSDGIRSVYWETHEYNRYVTHRCRNELGGENSFSAALSTKLLINFVVVFFYILI